MNKHSIDAIRKVDAGRLIHDLDLGEAELVSLLELTIDVKANPARYAGALQGKILSLLFEKPSLRTRLTFEVAAKQLGGDSILCVGPVGDREPIKDVARNLERWTSCIVARTFSQETIEELARWSAVPVINALSNLYHPCQALADVFTLKEHFGDLPGLKLAYVGDGNNVAHSLMLTAARLGVSVAVATPPGYEPDSEIAHKARGLAEGTGARVTVTNEPAEVLQDADAVYTDVWASMGQEGQKSQRRKDFAPYQVDEGLMKMAKPSAIFMHCLPARRGEEVTDAVIESPQSVVFDQAENRLHTQKALLLMLLA
jgi:ornithine carbamoyltransferase